MGTANTLIPPPPPGFKLEDDIPPPPPGFKLEDAIPPPPPGFKLEGEPSAAPAKTAWQHFTDIGSTAGQYITDFARKALSEKGLGTLWGILPPPDAPKPLPLTPDAAKSASPVPAAPHAAIPTPEKGDKVLGNYDLSGYASDPKHVNKISDVMKEMPDFQDADSMTQWIQRRSPNSPITGDMVLGSAARNGVDPKTLLGLITVESQLGTAGLGVTTRNPGNVGNNDAGETQTFPDFESGLDAAAQQLAKRKTIVHEPPDPIDWATATPEQKNSYSNTLTQFLKTATPDEKKAFLSTPRPEAGIAPPPEKGFYQDVVSGMLGLDKFYGSTFQDKAEVLVDADRQIRMMHDSLKDWVDKTNEHLKEAPPTQEEADAIQKTFAARVAAIQAIVDSARPLADAADAQRASETGEGYQIGRGRGVLGRIMEKPMIPAGAAWDYIEHDPMMVLGLHLDSLSPETKATIGSVSDMISGLTTMSSMGLMAGAMAAPEAAAAISPRLAQFVRMAISGYFSFSLLSDAIKETPQAIEHLRQGKDEQGTRELGNAIAKGLLGGVAGVDAATRSGLGSDIADAARKQGPEIPPSSGFAERVPEPGLPPQPPPIAPPPEPAAPGEPVGGEAVAERDMSLQERIEAKRQELGRDLNPDEWQNVFRKFNLDRQATIDQSRIDAQIIAARTREQGEMGAGIGAPPEPLAPVGQEPSTQQSTVATLTLEREAELPPTIDDAVAQRQGELGRPLTPLERVEVEQSFLLKQAQVAAGIPIPAEEAQSQTTTSRTQIADDGGSIPETNSALLDQVTALTERRRDVMMIPTGTPPETIPPLPKGINQIQTPIGMFWTTGAIDPIKKAVDDGTWPTLLGFVSPQGPDATQLVVARNPQTGSEIISAQTRPEDVDEQKANFAKYFPDAVISDQPIAEGAQQIIAERISGIPQGEGLQAPPESAPLTPTAGELAYPPEAGPRTVPPDVGQMPAISGIPAGAVIDKDVPSSQPPSVSPVNAEERNRGSIDSMAPLDAKGLTEAKNLGERIKARGGLDWIETSDLLRTRQTSDEISKVSGSPIHVTTGNLRPMGLGELEGQKTADTIHVIQDHILNNPDKPFPGQSEWSTMPGESVNGFTRRVLTHISKLLEELREHPDLKVGVVTHYRIIKALQSWLSAGAKPDFSIDPEEMMRKDGDPGSVYRLSITPNGLELHREDMENSDPLKPGLYIIRHGTTGLNQGTPIPGKAPGLGMATAFTPPEISFEPDHPIVVDTSDMQEAVADYARKTIGGEERAVTGFDPRLVKVLGGNLYTGDLGKIAVKEMLQNSVAGIMELPPDRIKNASITVTVDTMKREIKVSDTGAGMPPDIATKELVDMGGTHKAPGAPGGFGIAKAAIFTNSESINIATRALNPITGDLQETVLTGSNDDWLDPERGLKVQTTGFHWEASRETAPTGTEVSITLAPETRFEGYYVQEFLKKFLSDNMLPFHIQASINGQELKGTQVVKNKVTELKVPGADVTIYIGDNPHAEETRYTQIDILDTGLPQFDVNVYLPRAAKMPKVWANIRATGKPEDANYPFRPDRQGIRDEVKDAIEDYVKETLFKDIIKGEVNTLKDQINKRLQLRGSPSHHLYDTADGIPRDLMKELASASYIPKLTELLALASKKMAEALTKFIGYNAHTDRAEFSGLSATSGDLRDRQELGYYGIHIRTWMIPTMESEEKAIMLINPWLSAYDASRMFENTTMGQDQFPHYVARQLMATLVHEWTHAQYGAHDERFSSALTQAIGVTSGIVEKYGDLLGRVFANDGGKVLSEIIDHSARIKGETVPKSDAFGKVSSSTRPRPLAGYPERALEAGPGGRSGLEESVQSGLEIPPGRLAPGPEPGPGGPGANFAEAAAPVAPTSWDLRIAADDAIDDIEHIRPEDVANFGKIPIKDEGIPAARIVALGIAQDIRRKGFVSLVGRTAKDAKEMASIAEVLRNPAFERTHFLYVKNGVVVGHEASTCGRPEGVSVVPREGKAQFFADIKNKSEKLGADQIYLLHNHPSGDPKPSKDDVDITKYFASQLSNFAEHVVIDHEVFARIDRDGKPLLDFLPEKIGEEDKLLTASVEHPVLKRRIFGSNEAAAVARELNAARRMFSLIYRDSKEKVRAVEELPLSLLSRHEEFQKWVKRRTGVYGARGAVAAISRASVDGEIPSDLIDAAKIHFQLGTLADVIFSTNPESEFKNYVHASQFAGKPIEGLKFGAPVKELFTQPAYESGMISEPPEEEQKSFLGRWAEKTGIVPPPEEPAKTWMEPLPRPAAGVELLTDPNWENRLREMNARGAFPAIDALKAQPPFPMSSGDGIKEILERGGPESDYLLTILFEDEDPYDGRYEIVSEPMGMYTSTVSEEQELQDQIDAYKALSWAQRRNLSESLRYYHLENRDPIIAEANQIRTHIEKEIPDKLDQQALFFYREFKNRIPELQQLLDGTHPYYDQFATYYASENPQANARLVALEKQDAIKRVQALRPIIERAMSATPKMVTASGIMDNFFTRMLLQGRQEGFLESGILPEDYVTHIMFFNAEPTFGSMSSVGGGAMGQRFNYGSKRSFKDMAQGIIYEQATHFRPATINALDAMTVYADRFAKVSAARKLQQFLINAGLAEISAANNPDRELEWITYTTGMDPLWKRPVKYNDPHTGELIYYEKFFYGPEWAVEALRPITDPNWMNTIKGYTKFRMYQGWLKSIELSFSLFHMKAMTLCALADNPIIIKKFLESGWMETPEFEDLERLFVAHGGNTSILGKTLDAYNELVRPRKMAEPGKAVKYVREKVKQIPKSILPGSDDDPLIDRLPEVPIVKQLNSVAGHITEYIFGRMQRVFKVTSFALQDAQWIASHPKEAQDPNSLRQARRSIAKSINGIYGGLNWEGMGVGKVTRAIAQAAFLAPDWFFSNLALIKYALQPAPRALPGFPGGGGGGLLPPPGGGPPGGGGGGGTQGPGFGRRLFKSTPAGRKARWFILIGLMNGMVLTQLTSLLFTGAPSKDLFDPTIGKDKKGRPVKLLSPFFAGLHSDGVNYIRNCAKFGDPVTALVRTLATKEAPGIRIIGETVENRDRLGRQIAIKGAMPGVNLAREIEHLGKIGTPITITSLWDMYLDRNKQNYIIPEYFFDIGLATRSEHAPIIQRPERRPIGWWGQYMKGKVYQGKPTRPRKE